MAGPCSVQGPVSFSKTFFIFSSFSDSAYCLSTICVWFVCIFNHTWNCFKSFAAFGSEFIMHLWCRKELLVCCWAVCMGIRKCCWWRREAEKCLAIPRGLTTSCKNDAAKQGFNRQNICLGIIKSNQGFKPSQNDKHHACLHTYIYQRHSLQATLFVYTYIHMLNIEDILCSHHSLVLEMAMTWLPYLPCWSFCLPHPPLANHSY